jgi:flavin reductase (DIM6/NTAB) family NADH-FMN oxidoreductase RutF
MTKKKPMTNAEESGRAVVAVLSFELRHSLAIRASSFVIFA